MKSILILTKDVLLYNRVRDILNKEEFSCNLADPDNIILSMYRYDAKFFIVDMDFCERTTINTLRDITEIEYIPMVGVYSEYDKINDSLYDFLKYFVSKDSLIPSLSSILDSFVDFKIQYDRIKECNETIDLIDSEIDMLFRTQTYSNKSVIQNVFASNEFLKNKPSEFIIFSVKSNKTYVDVYRVSGGSTFKDELRLTLESSDFLKNNLTIETEFYSNCDKAHFSDVDTYKNIFETVLKNKDIKIKNFSGYATTDTAVVAINYCDYVSNTDAKIIKALCINLNLIKNVHRKIAEVNEAFIYTIEALARAGEAADDDTGSHIKRVNEYSKLISELLGMDGDFIEKIYYSAQMHDVGKIHIPHNILKKNGPLTSDEFNTMKLHTVYGPKIIGNATRLQMASEIALNHHERFDGTGYPNGLYGEEIPLSARIVSIADVYDALRNERVYKPPFSHEKTIEIITIGDGRVKPEHFDPSVLTVFKSNHKKFDEIWSSFKSI